MGDLETREGLGEGFTSREIAGSEQSVQLKIPGKLKKRKDENGLAAGEKGFDEALGAQGVFSWQKRRRRGGGVVSAGKGTVVKRP